MIKVGCAAYSYNSYLESRKMKLEDFIEEAYRLRLDGVELTGYYFERTDAKYLDKLKRLSLRRGLAISGTAIGSSFCHADRNERERQIRMVKDWVDVALRLGAPCLRVFGGEIPTGYSEEEAIRWTVDSLKACCEYAEQNGTTIALENHGGITSTAKNVIRIAKEVDSEWFGINLDLGNYHGNIYEEIAMTAPYAVHAHAKMFEDQKALKRLDFKRVRYILESAGYNGFVSLEYEGPEDPKVAVPSEIKRLMMAFQ
ncbi:MAG: sugar phosphate isomerase/epimerase family protein [Thermoproteota archaeon]